MTLSQRLTSANICVFRAWTTARCFQHKLAMRCKAKEVVIPQPQFVSLFNYEVLDEFMKRTSSRVISWKHTVARFLKFLDHSLLR